MFEFLKSKSPEVLIPHDQIQKEYHKQKWKALIGVFVAYMAYYLLRNNFILSTPHLMEELRLTNAQIGYLSSLLLISYGVGKGAMGSFADKYNPKYYMVFGLLLSCIINVFMGFCSNYFLFMVFIVINGVVQAMGAAPAFIVIANWFPRLQRGRTTGIWNISHNVGGGLVAPLSMVLLFTFGSAYWRIAYYWGPAIIVAIIAVLVLIFGKGTTKDEGLPPLREILPEDNAEELVEKADTDKADQLSAGQILWRYAIKNKLIWFISLADASIYLIRFGVLIWLPIYLLQEKGFSRDQMGTAFAIFEWAAIPTTLFAGYLSDKFFRGRRMPLSIICTGIIFISIFFYWFGSSLLLITTAAGIVGAMIYVPQFLTGVLSMDIVPNFAVGSVTGFRGFMSYILGATLATALIGKMVDLYGWGAGFLIILAATLSCIIFCTLAHIGTIAMQKKRLHPDQTL